MITSKQELLRNVKFRLGDNGLNSYARIETEHGQPVANFAACDGKARELAARVVELLNRYGTKPRKPRAPKQTA
jgi:hypothetical protein